jgi:SmpA / OmlA family
MMTRVLVQRISTALVVAATVASLSACVSIGHAFPTPDATSVGVGKLTQADIQRTYGSPFRTGVEDGDVTWTYVNYKLRVFGSQCTQDLVIRFNASGTVKSFTYNTTQPGSCG